MIRLNFWLQACAECAFFTARCTLCATHGSVIVFCPSVCLSACNVGDLWSYMLGYFESNSTIN